VSLFSGGEKEERKTPLDNDHDRTIGVAQSAGHEGEKEKHSDPSLEALLGSRSGCWRGGGHERAHTGWTIGPPRRSLYQQKKRKGKLTGRVGREEEKKEEGQ